MCCFSGKVDQVKNTRIFARLGEGGSQFLIYEMDVSARQDVAMVLPVPVKPGSGEGAVSFFSFKDYPQVFADLHDGFPVPRSRGAQPFAASAGPPESAPPLAVHSVGSYDASFVPRIADFSRLDARFRLPDQVWEKLPGYREFGFVVFKLKLTKGSFHSHPMAFAFPTARPDQLFFPTLHIHDGEIHEKEEFDHTLYCQTPAGRGGLDLWEESARPAVAFAKCGQTHGALMPDLHVRRRQIQGMFTNGDIVAKPRLS